MKEKKAAGGMRQRHDEVFKREALRLWAESGRPAESIAHDLGVTAGDLYRWKRVRPSTRAAGSAVLPVGQEALESEVVRLRQEVSRLTEQRDILKKAAGILCELPPRGMPGSNL
jgi:transposase